MHEGDGILFYGPRSKIRDFNPEKSILIYHKTGDVNVSASLRKKAPLAAAILITAVAVAVLGGVAVIGMALTQPIHNAAVAVIMTPVAIQAAGLLDSNPKAFCVAVVIACSNTFLMPYGHPAPYLVQQPGNYKSSDYLKFGLPLNAISLAVILTVIPWLLHL